MSVRIRPGDQPEPAPMDGIRDVFAVDAADDSGDDGAAPGTTFLRPGRDRLAILRDVPVRRLVAGGLVAAVGVAVVGGLAYRLSLPASRAGVAPAAAPTSAAPTSAAAPQPSASASASATASAAASLPPTNDMSAVSWQGAALPVSDADGPFEFTNSRAGGFTQTPQGAALAAVHISTHLDAYTGPGVFTSTIKEQVLGDTTALLAKTRKLYQRAAKANGVSDGRPVIAPTGSITAWQIDRYHAHDRNEVRLLVRTPTGDEVVYVVPVVWSGGDWRVDLSAAAPGETFRTEARASDEHYRQFISR